MAKKTKKITCINDLDKRQFHHCKDTKLELPHTIHVTNSDCIISWEAGVCPILKIPVQPGSMNYDHEKVLKCIDAGWWILAPTPNE